MSIHLESMDEGLMGDCSVCGRVAELFELPGRNDKSCPEMQLRFGNGHLVERRDRRRDVGWQEYECVGLGICRDQ